MELPPPEDPTDTLLLAQDEGGSWAQVCLGLPSFCRKKVPLEEEGEKQREGRKEGRREDGMTALQPH